MADAMRTRMADALDMALLAKTLGVEAAELEKAIPSSTVCKCPPGTVIINEGQAGNDVYVLVGGFASVRKSKWVFFGREVAKLQPGDIFGEINFLIPTARSATVVAGENCEVFRLTPEEFQRVLDSNPGLRVKLEELARQRIYALSAGA